MSMRYAAILLVVVLGGCGHPPPVVHGREAEPLVTPAESSQPCGDAASLAVYRRIEDSGMPWHTYLEVWLSRNYDPTYWRPQFDDEQHRIDAIRKWAETLPPGCVRDDYNQWLDYYWEPDLHQAEDEVRTHKTQKEMAEFYRRNAEEGHAARVLENDDDKIPIPPGIQQGTKGGEK